MKRALTRLAALAALLYVLAVGGLWAFQETFIFPGWEGPSAVQVASVPGLEEIVIPGTVPLRAWMRAAGPGAPTIVIFHGNAGTQWSQLEAFAARDWGILIAAYRGFAGNAGDPTEAGLYADAEAVLAYAAETGLAPGETVLYGESLGTGVATRMATQDAGWRALVLDAPYTSVTDRAAEHYPWVPVHALIRHEFDTKTILPQVAAPILILHGTEDEIIPIHHGRELAALVPRASAVWIAGDDHFLAPDRVAEELAAFLR
jgi:pimeloyl-ACP methyl ester carboxylesterase